MKFIATLTAAITLVASVSAAAIVMPGGKNVNYGSLREGTASTAAFNIERTTTSISRRDGSAVDTYWLFQTCYDANYTGRCQMWYGFDKKCYNFGPEWENQITSIKVDIELEHECTFFVNKDCSGGQSVTFAKSNSPDLRISDMDDKAKSYSCKANARVVIIPVLEG